MLLFDIIRDWFVQYIWGGCSSTGDFYSISLGNFTNAGGDFGTLQGDTIYLPIGNFVSDDSVIFDHLSFSDWLSTTSTIIVMILLCIIFGLMVRWLFRLTSGLLQGKC